MKNKVIYFILIALFLASDLYAQNVKIEYDEEEDTEESEKEQEGKRKKPKHTLEYNSKGGRIYYYNSEKDDAPRQKRSRWYQRFDRYYDDMPLFRSGKKPTVSIAFGTQGSLYADSKGSIQFNYFDASLGYVSEKRGISHHILTEFEHQYISVSNVKNMGARYESYDLTGIKSETWRVEAGGRDGYGYRSGSFAFTPYHGNALVWSSMNVSNLSTLPMGQQVLLSEFDNAVRFGMTTESGARIDFIQPIAFEASFQRAILMRRFTLLQWAGSYGLELATHALLDSFIREIRESSPLFAPIMNFILKNGLAYGIYQLRQEKANFPFNSEPPLSYDMFRVGMTLSF